MMGPGESCTDTRSTNSPPATGIRRLRYRHSVKIDHPHLNANYSMIDRTFGPTRIASESKKEKSKGKRRKKETRPIMCSRRRNRLPLRSRSPLTASGERTCPNSAKSPETGSQQQLLRFNICMPRKKNTCSHNYSLLTFGETYEPYWSMQEILFPRAKQPYTA